MMIKYNDENVMMMKNDANDDKWRIRMIKRDDDDEIKMMKQLKHDWW